MLPLLQLALLVSAASAARFWAKPEIQSSLSPVQPSQRFFFANAHFTKTIVSSTVYKYSTCFCTQSTFSICSRKKKQMVWFLDDPFQTNNILHDFIDIQPVIQESGQFRSNRWYGQPNYMRRSHAVFPFSYQSIIYTGPQIQHNLESVNPYDNIRSSNGGYQIPQRSQYNATLEEENWKDAGEPDVEPSFNGESEGRARLVFSAPSLSVKTVYVKVYATQRLVVPCLPTGGTLPKPLCTSGCPTVYNCRGDSSCGVTGAGTCGATGVCQCNTGYSLSSTTGTCIQISGCSANSDCGQNLIGANIGTCSGGLCTCRTGFTLNAKGTCSQVNAMCTTVTDCGPTVAVNSCNNGLCACKRGYTINAQGTCSQIVVGCTADVDCGTGTALCVVGSGICVCQAPLRLAQSGLCETAPQ